MLTEAQCPNAVCPQIKNKPGLQIQVVCTCKSVQPVQNVGF